MDNSLLYTRTLFFIKLWSGEEIKEDDFLNFCPFTSEYIKILLEIKFKRRFSDDEPTFKKEILLLSHTPIPMRSDNYLNFLISQSLNFSKSMGRRFNRQRSMQFYKSFFSTHCTYQKFKQFFKKCRKNGLVLRKKGELARLFLMESTSFTDHLMAIQPKVIERQKLRIKKYFIKTGIKCFEMLQENISYTQVQMIFSLLRQ